LTLDDYCIGTGDNNSFCWWIERGLKSLGYYFPGRSWSYLIYWNKANKEYSKHGPIRQISDDEEAMQRIASVLSDLVNAKNSELGLQYFGESFVLKILNSYFPKEYFPFNSREYLINALRLFNINEPQLTTIQMNQRLNSIFIEKNKQFNSDVTTFEFMTFLISTFGFKKGINLIPDNPIVTAGEFHLIQFHPAYSYEDFVRGIVASINSDNQVSYEVANKILATFSKKAEEDPNNNYVLIIDEINRSNLPAVLGELIYALEYRGKPVSSAYEYKNDSTLMLPENLFIIGTMNTADRTLSHIDYAIRRRFAFVDILPKISVIEGQGNPKALELFQFVNALFCKNYTEGSQLLQNSEYLAADFRPADIMPGHSYFLAKNDEELAMKLEYEIKPLLREYLKDGILLEPAREIIETLHV
jgi:5-methylcytosine-specific restriction protein B